MTDPRGPHSDETVRYAAGAPEALVHLSALTWTEAKHRLAGGRTVAFLPCGSTEAHGPHLALSTDVVIATHAASCAAGLLAEKGTQSLVLPPLAYAVTEYAGPFAGTVGITEDTARALVRDVITSAVRTGFAGVVLCNAHLEPAHLATLRDGAEAARGAGARVAFPDVTKKPHALRLGEEFKSGACHAGSYETSLVLAADASLVRDEHRILSDVPISLSRAIKDGKRNFVEAGGDRAYFGSPARATEAEGTKLYAELADIFAAAALEVLP